ncbi:MAG: erythromycin esterase family protein [Lachnospiraceae bacterium]|nr:erythromycin esterase family protein [Lachnospiraceae bacterium]
MKLWKKKPLDPIKEARRKRRKKMRRIIDAITIFAVICYIFIPVGLAQFKVKNFEQYAQDVTMLHVPDVKIVALGEATHGNAEFQELKLTVLKQLVTQGYHAFALEADYGDCAVINDWLQGGEGTAEEMTQTLSFRLYRTDKMKELLSWIYDYNQTVDDDDKIRFYGFDLQGMTRSANHILAYCRAHDLSEVETYANELESMEMPKEYYSEEDAAPILTLIQSVRELLEAHPDETDIAYRRALHETDCLYNAVLMNEDSRQYAALRDMYMAENVEWIVAEEEKLGNAHIILSGHNGHVAKMDKYRKVMGAYLTEIYENDYFVIGTDFYDTNCNMPGMTGERVVKHFVSADPLAAQLKRMDTNTAYLDFASVPESETGLYRKIHSKMTLGSLGEAYSPIMKLYTYTYRTHYVPSDLYNAMIFVYKATPTDCQ